MPEMTGLWLAREIVQLSVHVQYITQSCPTSVIRARDREI